MMEPGEGGTRWTGTKVGLDLDLNFLPGRGQHEN